MTVPQCTITISDLSALIGVDDVKMDRTEVWFTPNLGAGELLALDSSLKLLEPVRGITDAGVLKDLDGNVGVSLLANDPSLNLSSPLQWRVEFRRADVQGFIRRVNSWWFEAPNAGTTVDLSTLAAVPGLTATGWTRGPSVDDVRLDGGDLVFSVEGQDLAPVSLISAVASDTGGGTANLSATFFEVDDSGGGIVQVAVTSTAELDGGTP